MTCCRWRCRANFPMTQPRTAMASSRWPAWRRSTWSSPPTAKEASMTDPTRYDAVDDKLVECLKGKVVRYADWLAERQAVQARISKLAMGPDDWLLVTVGEEYDSTQAAAMAGALQRGTGRQVL